jgi:hypothetical protein|nr:MAG TPA: hypothetical protein [Caudoviricetes sp.]
MKTAIKILSVVFLVGASVCCVIFKNELESFLGQDINSVVLPLVTSIISVFAGLTFIFSKLKSAIGTLTDKDIKVTDIYSKTNKIFEEFKADFMSIKAENEELRIAIDRLIKIKSKASDAAVLLMGQDNAAVKNGTAAKIAEVLNDEQND